MQILQLIGVLIIVNALTSAAWYASQGKSLGFGGISLVVVAVLVGLALTFHERAIELSFGKLGSLKAAAQQATTDANEIAAIRQRVEAQAATLDLVAKESADAKRLLENLRKANDQADEKLKALDEKTTEAKKLAEPATLSLKAAVKDSSAKELTATVFFEASKNEAFGRLDFEVKILEGATAKIIKLWPSTQAGAFQSGEKSFQLDADGRRATLTYIPMGALVAAFDIVLSEPAIVEISGDRMVKPANLKIE